MTLAEKISYLRKKEGISQEELAERLSVSRQSIYKWETGDAIPGWDKIKHLAKMFNISFDYLMDDSINDIDSDTCEKKQKNIERNAFSTGIDLNLMQLDIDNGYFEARKAKLKISYLGDNIKHAESALNTLNITDIYGIQMRSATHFFYDSNNYTCGFFYAGMIQFVCPIENILGFTYGGGNHKVVNSSATVSGIGFGSGGINSVGIGQIPTLNSIPDTTAWCSLSYKDKGIIKSFDMNFSVLDSFKSEICGGGADDLMLIWSADMDLLQKSLEKLKLKVDSLIEIGKEIKSGDIAVETVNYDIIINKNKELEGKYKEYIYTVMEETIRDNKKRLITMSVFGGIVVILAFILIKVLLS